MVEFNPDEVVELYVDEDVETAERCGASGTFQVISAILTMSDGTEIDVTSNVDQGQHFYSQKEVAEALGINSSLISYQ